VAARKVKVKIAPGCVVYIDGAAHSAGQVVQVPAAEAKALVEQGVAER
jgi:hypothetical protein